MNALHLHMYNVGILSLAMLLVMYPAETSVSIAAKATVAAQAKETPIVINRR